MVNLPSHCAMRVLLYLTLGLCSAAATPAASLPDVPGNRLDESYDGKTAMLEGISYARHALRTTFPQLAVDRIEKSEIPGIFRIFAGKGIVYYAPAQGILIKGELYRSDGVSLTQTRLAQDVNSRLALLSNSSVLSIGGGAKTIAAFVDPDCRFCRHAAMALEANSFKGVRVYVYVMPVSGRPDAEAKALRFYCSSDADRRDAFRALFEESTRMTPSARPTCAEGRKRLEASAAIAQKMGIYATPTFIAQGQVIAGFNEKKLASIVQQ
jgi:hypothetical protein